MMVMNIQLGFRKIGVYPVNFEAKDRAKFSLSFVTDSKTICIPCVDSIGLLSTEDCVLFVLHTVFTVDWCLKVSTG